MKANQAGFNTTISCKTAELRHIMTGMKDGKKINYLYLRYEDVDYLTDEEGDIHQVFDDILSQFLETIKAGVDYTFDVDKRCISYHFDNYKVMLIDSSSPDLGLGGTLKILPLPIGSCAKCQAKSLMWALFDYISEAEIAYIPDDEEDM